MNKNTPKLGHLSARQFISDCKDKGLPTPANHIEWVLHNGFVQPVISDKKTGLYNTYQIYILDKIEDYRQESLKTPRTQNGVGLTWQEYLIDHKKQILDLSLHYNRISELLLDIQLMMNKVVNQSLSNKDGFNHQVDPDERVQLEEMIKVSLSNNGRGVALDILKKYPDLNPDIIRQWMSNIFPALIIKHNPGFKLYSRDLLAARLFTEHELLFTSIFTSGNPVRLSNFYFHLVELLHFFLSCLNQGKEDPIYQLFEFIAPKNPRLCSICHKRFTPKKSGKSQFTCGSKKCDVERRRRREVQSRKNKKLGLHK